MRPSPGLATSAALWPLSSGLCSSDMVAAAQAATPGTALPALHDLPLQHLLQFLNLTDVAHLRLTCTRLQAALDHNLECIRVDEDVGAKQLLTEQANISRQQRPSLLSRLWHLRRLTYLPTSRPGFQSQATLMQLVQTCLEASNGALVELRVVLSEMVTASERAAQQRKVPLDALHSLVKMHPAGWRLLDLPVSSSSTATTPFLPDTSEQPPCEPSISPLASFLAGLPSTLSSLTLRLSLPHHIFSALPRHLTSLTHLEITNYNGGSAVHAWVLATGLPGLQSLALSWPLLPALQQPRVPTATLGADVAQGSARPSWLSESDAAAFAAWQQATRTAGTVRASAVNHSVQSENHVVTALVPPAPLSFWHVLSHVRSLRRLRLRLDAASVPVDDLPLHLTQLQELHLALLREGVLPGATLHGLLAMPRLTTLCLEQVNFLEDENLDHSPPAKCKPLHSLCTSGVGHLTLAKLLGLLGPGNSLRHLHIARPASVDSHWAWAGLLKVLPHLESLVLDGLWALDSQTFAFWSSKAAANDTCALAARLSHLGLLLSGCRASPEALEAFACACTNLQTLELGHIACRSPLALKAWAQQPRLAQVMLPQMCSHTLQECVLALSSATPDSLQQNGLTGGAKFEHGLGQRVITCGDFSCPCRQELTGRELLATRL